MCWYARIRDLPPRRMRTRANSNRRRIMRGQVFGMRDETAFDFLDDSFRLNILPVDHQPARTFRNPSPKKNHDQAERCADSKGKTPTQPDWQSSRVEKDKRRC